MKIGVRVHDLGKDTPENLAKKAASIGFNGVQLVLNKAIIGETGLPGTLNTSKAKMIYQAFDNEGLDIAMLGAYFNPVHSNRDLVETCVKKFEEHLSYANDFHTLYVG